MDRRLILAFGIIACLAEVALWHGPMGGGERFAARIDAQSRAVLDNYEMVQVDGRLARRPLRRTLLLSGPADDFQREQLVLIMAQIRGVGSARWVDTPRPVPPRLPLLAEAELFGLVGFGLGLLLAYLFELRRRWRAEWRW
jgi:hypothetical protein